MYVPMCSYDWDQGAYYFIGFTVGNGQVNE